GPVSFVIMPCWLSHQFPCRAAGRPDPTFARTLSRGPAAIVQSLWLGSRRALLLRKQRYGREQNTAARLRGPLTSASGGGDVSLMRTSNILGSHMYPTPKWSPMFSMSRGHLC